MIRTLLVLLACAHSIWADDFLKRLTPKDLTPEMKSRLQELAHVYQHPPGQCSIRLKEIRVERAERIDSIKAPGVTHKSIDQGIEHPVPIPACPAN